MKINTSLFYEFGKLSTYIVRSKTKLMNNDAGHFSLLRGHRWQAGKVLKKKKATKTLHLENGPD